MTQALLETNALVRPEYFSFHNGEKAPMIFSRAEYDRRLAGVRKIMAQQDIEATILTSMHGVAYYSGFLYLDEPLSFICTPF